MAQASPLALPPKLYFRIGEVAELVGVEPHVLRYWEREFRSIRPTKSAKGQRVYSRRDVENLMRVRELLYKEGFTIAGAKKKLHRPDVDARATETPAVDAAGAAPGGPAEKSEGHGESEVVALHASEPPPESARIGTEIAPESEPHSCRPSARERGELLAMRGEIEAFLAELEIERG
jgi:DNA-binding transcriptional MerR regulator